MKRYILTALALSFAASTALAAANYNVLKGSWSGTITTNLKDTTGGGKPTMGDTGTPVDIMFEKSGDGLAGTSTIGDSKEKWTVNDKQYTFNDGEITVTAVAADFSTIPEWVQKEAEIAKTDTVFAYKYKGCTINATKKPCEIGKNLPDGIDKTGIWLFTVKGKTMHSSVYYKYSTGGKRVLEQSLTAKK